MRFNCLKRIITCAMCLLAIFALCACNSYVDQDFVNLNNQVQPTTELTEPIATEPSIAPTTPPTETVKPTVKPGGFVLPDESTPSTSEPTNPTSNESTTEPTQSESPEPSAPSEPSTSGSLNGVKVSKGLKAALNSIGRTTYGKVTAVQPLTGADGSNTIIHIQNNGNTAQQYVYMYYESSDDYAKASNSVSKDSCNDKLRLILRGEAEVLPVTNPETMGIVLFDGYLLWR